jgi:MSHA biogenesis protein MshG
MTATFSPLMELITALSSGTLRRKTASPSAFSDPSILAILVSMGGAIGIWIWIAAVRQITKRADAPRSEGRNVIARIFKTIAWVLFYLGLLAAMTMLSSVLGILLWFFTLIVALSIKVRHGDAERRALMWLLGTAVEKGVPLGTAARSFGDGRYDRLGRQTRKLAMQLDRGISLGQAIDNVGPRLPTDALVAVHAGATTHSYAPLIQATTRRAPGMEDTLHSISAKLLYVMTFLLFASLSIAFIFVKIVPAYIKIFADFEAPLPSSTILLINIGLGSTDWIFLLFPVLLALLATMIFALLRYAGTVRWDPPVVRHLASLLDRANILRNLSEAVGKKVPIQAMFDNLAQKYPKGYIRMKLYKAGHSTAAGTHWCNSMIAAGLLSNADAAVLKSAERAGNLSWAMNEVAARLSNRFVSRTNAILGVLFPLILFTFAAIVFLVAYGMIEPLSHLVMNLSEGK